MNRSQSYTSELRATTPEQYLVGRVKELLLCQFERIVRPEPDGMTRFDRGVTEGQVVAYLDAILSVRAGSAYYVDDRWNLRSELLAEARRDLAAE